MGCSNPHPHGQVWSLSEIPTLPATELASFRRYRTSTISMLGGPKGPEGACLVPKFGVIIVRSSCPFQGDPVYSVTMFIWNCVPLEKKAVSL